MSENGSMRCFAWLTHVKACIGFLSLSLLHGLLFIKLLLLAVPNLILYRILLVYVYNSMADIFIELLLSSFNRIAATNTARVSVVLHSELKDDDSCFVDLGFAVFTMFMSSTRIFFCSRCAAWCAWCVDQSLRRFLLLIACARDTMLLRSIECKRICPIFQIVMCTTCSKTCQSLSIGG